MSSVTESINKCSPEQLDLLLRRIKASRNGNQSALLAPRSAVKKVPFHTSRHGNFVLQVGVPGNIESLSCVACPRTAPGPNEVEIDVYAAGLNFRDVMIALGMYPAVPGLPPIMGGEVSGRIVAVGDGVADFKVGDDVIAVGMGAFRAFLTTGTEGVVLKPATLTFETAAAIPVVFITGFYGLHHLARLARGERVLIHSAAGGVGLAAIQIANWLGAEVFATVGTPAKKDFLAAMGLRHIMDSRSLQFADEVLKLTSNEGVDVILNSLAGEAIPKGIEILRPYGRFIEIGKRDLMENRQIGLLPFSKGLSFSAVDLTWLPSMRPGFLKGMFEQVMKLFEQSIFKPLPARFFSMADVVKAFSSMSQGTHIGKIVFLVKGQEVLVEDRSD